MADDASEFANGIKTTDSMLIQTSQQYKFGPPVDPLTRIMGYSPSEWEIFIEEWTSSLDKKYKRAIKFSGSADKGIDIAGFKEDEELNGKWDNYQCKHYTNPICFSDISSEIGKMIWHSFNGEFKAPEKCWFVSPRGASTELARLLSNASKLKMKIEENWDQSICKKIAKENISKLNGDFLTYFNAYDFKSFSSKTLREVIDEHKKTQFYIERFGGGLPARPKNKSIPENLDEHEETYTACLLEAYSEKQGEKISDHKDLGKWPKIKTHFDRSRESFYHAESLRVFVRDKSAPGTFESLQDEIYNAVIDTHDKNHPDGYERVIQVTNAAQNLPIDAHPLSASTFPTDKRGICHQLANNKRLKWRQ